MTSSNERAIATDAQGATGSAQDANGSLRFELADYRKPGDAAALVALLDAYACDPMGGGEPLDAAVRERLPAVLAEMPNAFTVLGYRDGQPIALANCFVTLSTFAARPIVNIHDLAVVSVSRGRGVGVGLLKAVETEARKRDACKITLEVLEGNARARRVYEQAGFRPYLLDAEMGTALFLQRLLEEAD